MKKIGSQQNERELDLIIKYEATMIPVCKINPLNGRYHIVDAETCRVLDNNDGKGYTNMAIAWKLYNDRVFRPERDNFKIGE